MSKKFLGFKNFCDAYKWKKAFNNMLSNCKHNQRKEVLDGQSCKKDAEEE